MEGTVADIVVFFEVAYCVSLVGMYLTVAAYDVPRLKNVPSEFP